MVGYGRVPYSELAIFANVQGYRGSELRDYIDELQWVDMVFNEVENVHSAEKAKNRSKGSSKEVRAPNAKEQAEHREIRRARIRAPISGVRK